VAVAVVVFVALVGSGLATYLASARVDALQAALSADLQRGSDYLVQGKDAVKRASSSNDPAPLSDAAADFEKARRSFEAAHSRVHGDFLVTNGDRVPWFGSAVVAPRLRTVDAIADMGIALANAGKQGAELAAQLLRPPGPEQTGGARMIAMLEASQAYLVQVKSALQRAKSAAANVDIGLLAKDQRQAFLKASEQINAWFQGLQDYERLAPVLLEVLGAAGPRTFLVEQIDPAELRGGGGFIGSYSLLTADKGVISLSPGLDIFTLESPYPAEGEARFVAPPAALRQAFGHGFVFGDSNFWPDFPTSARAGMDLLTRETGTKVDGVLCIDPWAVAALLKVTGPVAVPEYNTVVRADSFPEEVFERLEKEAANVPGKKAFFPAVAVHVIDRVSSLHSEDWSKLLDSLNSAVLQRHLQVYLDRPAAQAEVSRAGWTGELSQPSATQELMLETESNFGATKANHFLERSYQVTLTAADGKLRHQVVVNLKNSTPDEYLGGRHYNYYFRFYLPANATDISVRGLAATRLQSDEKPPNLALVDGWGFIAIKSLTPGAFATHQVMVDYTTSWASHGDPRSIYWQKQAGTLADKANITFNVDGRSFTVDTDLSTDRLLVLDRNGIQVKPATVGAAKLPTIFLGS
jgi:hypothetical protein